MTDDDVAKVPPPVAPTVESSTEPDMTQKEGTEKKVERNADAEDVVVEEDAELEAQIQPNTTAGKSELPVSFWQDDEEPDHTATTRAEEEDIIDEGIHIPHEETTTAISLVSAVSKNKSKSKRPKFRSRKVKGK